MTLAINSLKEKTSTVVVVESTVTLAVKLINLSSSTFALETESAVTLAVSSLSTALLTNDVELFAVVDATKLSDLSSVTVEVVTD